MQVNIPPVPRMVRGNGYTLVGTFPPFEGKTPEGLREASLGKFERAHRTPATGV